jgi:MFS family permease
VVAAVSSSLWIVVAGRVIQGVGGGIFPLCFAIIRDEFPRDRVARGVGLMSAIAGIGGGLGLVLGGVLVDHVSYHWIFWLGAGMGLIAAIAAQLFVPESPIRTPGRLDLRGALVLAVGLVLPLLAISQAPHVGWGSARTLLLIGAGVAVLAFWVALERRTPQPLADIEALAKTPVLMTNIATLLVGFGMFGSFILIPTLAQAPTSTGYGFGVDATRAGLLLLPGALMMLGFGPLSGIIGSRFGNKVPLAAGGALTGTGLGLLAAAHGSQAEVIAFGMVMSAGIGLAFAAMPNLIIDAVPARQTGEATGFNAWSGQSARRSARRSQRRSSPRALSPGSQRTGASPTPFWSPPSSPRAPASSRSSSRALPNRCTRRHCTRSVPRRLSGSLLSRQRTLTRLRERLLRNPRRPHRAISGNRQETRVGYVLSRHAHLSRYQCGWPSLVAIFGKSASSASPRVTFHPG